MIEELTPEIIWIAGLGAVVVFGLMIAVWYVSTREGGDKKEPTSTSSTSTLAVSKISRKKRQYGSPRKKKEIGGVNESESPDVVTETEINIYEKSEEEPHVTTPVDDVEVIEVPSQYVQSEEEKPKGSKGAVKVRSHEVKEVIPTDHRPLTDRPSTDRPSSIAKKTKAKVKQQQSHIDDFSEVSGSRIVQAVTNSTLSEEEVQQIMEKLLEKQDEEWEATGRGDNVKTLKKANEELITRCRDAEKSAQLHSQRVKELGSELKQEKSRLMTSEKAFQIKVGKQQEDIDNLKKKVQQYKEEVEMLKDVATSTSPSGEFKRLEENNQAIRNQLSQLVSEKSQVTTQVKELVDANKQLSLKLAKETEKLGTVQIEKKTFHNELLTSRGDVKRLEHEISELQGRAQTLQSQLALTEEALLKERSTNLSSDQGEKEKLQLISALKQEHMVAMQQLHDKHVLEMNEVKSQTHTELERMKADMSHLETASKNKEEQVDELSKENTSLKKDLQNMENEMRKLTEASEKAKVNGQLEVVQESVLSSPNSISEEEISELKLQNTALQEKIDDLKAKNNTLRDKSWKARDEQDVTIKECNDKLKASEKEHTRQMNQLRKSINEEHLQHMMFLKMLFPTIPNVNDKDFDEWIDIVQQCVSEKLKDMEEDCENKRKRIDDMTKEIEEGSQLTNELRDTLSDTLAKLEDLMKKWEEKENRYNDTIHKEELERTRIEEESKAIREKLETVTAEYNSCKLQCEALQKEKENLIQQEAMDMRSKLESLTVEYNSCKLQCEALQKERESLLQQNEEVVSNLQKHKESLQEEITLKEKATKEKEQVEERLKEMEEQVSHLTDENETLTKNVTQLKADVNDYKTKLQESELLAESLRSANKDFNQRLQFKFSPPPTSTSSDV